MVKSEKKTIKNRKKTLKGLEKITELLKLIFESGNLEDKPLSIILVAPVGSGKTTTIKQFKNNKNIFITTDSTAYGLLKNYQNQLKNREIRHIIIPDLHSALARKKTTADSLILFINNSCEDGLFPSKTYGIDLNEYIAPFGWVLCLTDEGFKKKYKFFKEIGFISRFLIVRYKYSPEQISTILEEIIKENEEELPDIKLKQKRALKKIKGNPKIFEKAKVYAKLLCSDEQTEILRTQRKIQTLLKSSASLRGDKEVKEVDLKKIEGLIELIKFPRK